MSLAVIPLAITMNAGPQIMSALIFVTANKPLKLSAYFLGGVVIAVTAGVTITYTLASVLGNSVPVAELASHHYPVDRTCTLVHHLLTAALHKVLRAYCTL